MARIIYIAAIAVVFVLAALAGINSNTAPQAVAVTESVPVVELEPFTDWAEQLASPSLSIDPYVWSLGVLASYDLELPEGATLHFTDKGNCGSEMSEGGTGGGCYVPAFGMIYVSPSIVGTESGITVLLHEYAHSAGILDECAAEKFAHEVFPTNLWGYPECSPAWQD